MLGRSQTPWVSFTAFNGQLLLFLWVGSLESPPHSFSFNAHIFFFCRGRGRGEEPGKVDKIGNVGKSQDVYLICGMVCLRQNHLWVHPSLNTTEMGTQVLERKSELLQLSWPECSYANLQSHLQPWCSSATGGRIQAGQGIH